MGITTDKGGWRPVAGKDLCVGEDRICAVHCASTFARSLKANGSLPILLRTVQKILCCCSVQRVSAMSEVILCETPILARSKTARGYDHYTRPFLHHGVGQSSPSWCRA